MGSELANLESTGTYQDIWDSLSQKERNELERFNLWKDALERYNNVYGQEVYYSVKSDLNDVLKEKKNGERGETGVDSVERSVILNTSEPSIRAERFREAKGKFTRKGLKGYLETITDKEVVSVGSVLIIYKRKVPI